MKGEIIGSRGQENVRLGVGWITAWMWRLKSTSSGIIRIVMEGKTVSQEGAEVISDRDE